MCGICGIVEFSGRHDQLEDLNAMLSAMQARGPDAAGVYMQAGVVLGHRRLKIIDLSEKAHQPMVDPFLGLSIVYNGALYNYKELRRQLEEKGYSFFSEGDTEVVLKAYHLWGERCVERFNGMFAFCILHRGDGSLFLARDRLGIKPLYYTLDRTRFCFASTLPALLTNSNVDTRIDSEAFNYYLTFHSVVPAPHTILKGVRKLPAATTMTVNPDGGMKTRTYWELSFQAQPGEEHYSEHDWSRVLAREIQDAVNHRLTADVPVGVLLSGGLDSSLLVGLLAQSGVTGLDTFSIGFQSAGGESGDEFQYSDLIAGHFGTNHHKIEIDTQRVLSALDPCIKAMSEPMMSHDCVGFYLLSREVARFNKVVLSGQGADEVFGGYYWYPPLMRSTEAVEDYAREFFDRGYEEYKNIVHADYRQGDWSRIFVRRLFERDKDLPAVDKALKLDTTIMLVDDPVKRVDNMTMAWGLEARVPFLDHRLVETAARIPARLKVANGGKYILKKVAREVIPAAVIDRPKGYFPVPALKYLQGEYLDFVEATVKSTKARQRNLFEPAYVEMLLNNPQGHHTPLRGSKLWQIALLERWLAVHGI